MTQQSSVLFDIPGPRARIRNRIIAIVFGIVLIALALYVLNVLADNGQLEADKWSPFLDHFTWTTYLLPGLKGTLLAAALSIVFALILGAILGIGRLSDHRWVRWLSGAIVEFFRAIPVLILMIFAYQVFAEYRVFKSEYLALAAVITGLTLYNGSVIAEIVRAGIRSLPRGQAEAAAAVGMRKNQIMRLILLPQAVTIMLPAIVSQMVIALKDSALGYLIGYVEVVRSGQQLGAFFANYLPALLVVAVIMIVLNSALTRFAMWLEKRLRSGRRKKGAIGAEDPDNLPTMEVPGLDMAGERRP